VGTPDGEVLGPGEAIRVLRASGRAGPELVGALESALARRVVVGSEG